MSGDAAAVVRKLKWAIDGAVAGHLSLEQLGELAGADDVAAVIS